jgi:hypothetical protein
MSYISHPSIHGKWASHKIDTLQDACDLEQAMQDGDSFALGYMSYINSVGQIPTNPRSMGVEHLIKQYNHIAKEFSSTLQKYKLALAAFKRKQARASSIPSRQPPAPGVPERATLTEQGHSAGDTDHYRLLSPMYYQGSPPEVEVPPTDDEMQVSNPRDPPQSVGLDWARVTVQNWP